MGGSDVPALIIRRPGGNRSRRAPGLSYNAMGAEVFHFLANAVVLLHFAFVAFVVLGGVLALRWRWLVWIHLPAAAWGVAIMFGGWICPLTPLENHLRHAAGQAARQGGFVESHVLPFLYPEGLTRGSQVALGLLALALNAVVYVVWLRRGAATR